MIECFQSLPINISNRQAFLLFLNLLLLNIQIIILRNKLEKEMENYLVLIEVIKCNYFSAKLTFKYFTCYIEK